MLIYNVYKYFDFLITDFGFSRIKDYSYSREEHTDYVKKNLIIKVIYDGDFWVELLKSNKNLPELQDGAKRTVDFEYNNFKRFDLKSLDPQNKIYNSVSSENFPEKKLWYYSKLLKENSEILEGDMSKFSFKYRLLAFLGF